MTTPGLRAFYTEIIEAFPPMNGPDAPDLESLTPEAEGRLAEYSIGSRIIQTSFRWPQAQRADELFRELAARHDVAIAWVSAPSGTMPITRPRVASSTHGVVGRAGRSFLGPGETVECFRTMFAELDASTRLLEQLEGEGFIQAAGSSDRLSVEVRTEVGGVADIYVLGRADAEVTAGDPSVVIPFGQHSTTVHENEVFSGEEAAELFFRFYETGEAPETHSLRPLGFVAQV